MSATTVRQSGEASADEALARLGAELMHRADESQAALDCVWDELMASWGVSGVPVGVARLRDMIRADNGNQPIDNEFSRELIALREERRP